MKTTHSKPLAYLPAPDALWGNLQGHPRSAVAQHLRHLRASGAEVTRSTHMRTSKAYSVGDASNVVAVIFKLHP